MEPRVGVGLRRGRRDQQSQEPLPRQRTIDRPVRPGQGSTDEGLERGLATHRFLQHLDLSRACDTTDLQQQQERLREAGLFEAADGELIDLNAVAWLFATELGRRLRSCGERVQREIPFVWRIPPQQYDPLLRGRDDRDNVLVRGTVDVLIRQETSLEIIDYKTDVIHGNACPERAESYRVQLDTYAGAMTAIHGLPVSRRSLVFLHARRIIDIDA